MSAFCPPLWPNLPRFALLSTNRNEIGATGQPQQIQLRARKHWRRGAESNRRIKVLQTSPLPLGYRALWFHSSGLPCHSWGKEGCPAVLPPITLDNIAGNHVILEIAANPTCR